MFVAGGGWSTGEMGAASGDSRLPSRRSQPPMGAWGGGEGSPSIDPRAPSRRSPPDHDPVTDKGTVTDVKPRRAALHTCEARRACRPGTPVSRAGGGARPPRPCRWPCGGLHGQAGEEAGQFVVAAGVALPLVGVGGDRARPSPRPANRRQRLEAPAPGQLGRIAAVLQQVAQDRFGLGGAQASRPVPCAAARCRRRVEGPGPLGFGRGLVGRPGQGQGGGRRRPPRRAVRGRRGRARPRWRSGRCGPP